MYLRGTLKSPIIIHMRIRHIHIEGYKVFNDFDIDFCLGGTPRKLMVVTGANGSGKTILLRDIISGNAIAGKAKYAITVQDDNGVNTLSFPVYPATGAHVGYFSKIWFYDTINDRCMERLQEGMINYIDRLIHEKRKNSFVAYAELQNMMDEIFIGFNLQIRFEGLGVDNKPIFVNSRNEEFGMEGLSSGELQVLSGMLLLFTTDLKGHVILIDEPEKSLHPSWQFGILPVLRRCSEISDCQIIVVTQSPQVIASAHREEIRLFVRDDGGYVRAKVCECDPYGWTVGQVLTQIQGVTHLRVPEIDDKLVVLKDMLRGNKHGAVEFKERFSELERILGYSDQDLILIRLEVIRREKKECNGL